MRTSIYTLFLTALSWLSLLTTAQASEFDEFHRLSEQLGGRQSSVYAIYRGANDFLWFASDTDGVLRYDGYDYVSWSSQLIPSGERVSYSSLLITPDDTLWAATWGHGLANWHVAASAAGSFSLRPEDPSSLRDDRVQTLYYDAKERLWVGTLNGLSYLVMTDKAKWQTRGLPAGHPLRTERIWWLTESSDYLWVATSQGLYRLTPDLKEWQHYLLNPAEQGPNRRNEIRTLAVFDSEVWVGTDFGVFFFDQQHEEFVPVRYPQGYENLGQVRSNVLAQDPFATDANTFWSGGSDGLHLIDRQRREYVRLDQEWGKLKGVDVRAIAFDSVSDMWVGARDQGIFVGRRDRQDFTETLSAAHLSQLGLAEQRATYAVHYSANNDLWLGTTAGVAHRDAQSQNWRLLSFPDDESVNQVETIYSDSHGNLWVATNTRLYRTHVDKPEQLRRVTHIHDQLELSDQAVNAILETDQNQLLLGFWGQGIATYNPVQQQAEWQFRELQGLRGNQVYDLVHLPQYGQFMVTRYSGVFQRSPDSQQWQSYKIKENGGDDYLCAYAEPPATLWLCSSEGAWRINLADRSRTLISMADGLPSDRVVGIYSDQQGYTWLLTSLGFARYDEAADSIINFGLNDGLPSEAMLRQAVSQSPAGEMTVGSVQGAFSYTPAELTLNTQPPQVALTKLMISGQDSTSLLGFSNYAMTLAPEDRSFTVHYSVMDFHDTARNSGRFRLLGASDEWSEWSLSREISFASLAPGDYVLQIEGRNSQGIVSGLPAELKIRVLKPWWQTSWAIGLALALLALSLYVLLRLRFRALEAANKRLDDEVQARTRELELANAQLRTQSETDPLTGLLNRRGFSERFRRLQQPLALVLLDVDHFKQVNDQLGHDVGDQVLKQIAGVLGERLRKQDIAGRWGGEEFIVMLPNTDLTSATGVCEALREGIASLVTAAEGHHVQVTATFGVTATDDVAATLVDCLKQADAALYQGKADGRNQVVAAQVDAVLSGS
ncbi:ligand-binding sensor domain-containing diguanylate cyclase [Pseudidiomarina terrestris]|uniref:ligand-binding sensor domain-containing diguanylate cyclase n=1 Tax=Pseudidiomarina terrestris TaxID=2820060 RepID=UPI00264AB1CD|nr:MULTISPECIES: ligand-binding sensor domain-containing diguanylate cyclase [unclassified Pseudidiomarina]MDN7128085.1 diguanylate cyclase [Pseudidiomarina sp. 1APR75-33.1]MDN7135751.1 diguanylate cyclase [Pseudidiomarina sp. 1ASP75-5]